MVWSMESGNRAFWEGYLNGPARARYLMDAYELARFDQGKRLREMSSAQNGSQPRQTFGEALGAAIALVGCVGGLLLGLLRVGSGEGGWLGVAGLAAGGGVLGVLLHLLLTGTVSRIRKFFLWKRGRKDRDAAGLILTWGAVFGETILPHVVAEVANEGRAWTLDGRGNFLLRTSAGKEFFIGYRPEKEGVVVESSGRPVREEDAYLVALIHKSLGRDSLRVHAGSRTWRRLLWAAATLTGIDVQDYTPDPKAMRILEAMKADPRFEVPVA